MNNIEHNIDAAAGTARQRLATLRRAQNAVRDAQAAFDVALATLEALEAAQRNAR